MVASRFVIDQTHPASLALLRYAIGVLCLLLPTLMAARRPFDHRDLLPIGLLGVIQFGVVVGLLNYALQFIPSARAALMFATFPLLTMLVAALLGHERVTLPKALGVVLTIIGVGLALGQKVMQPGAVPYHWRGELTVLASALSGAFATVLYRPYLRKYPTLQVSTFAMSASVGFLVLLAAGEGFFGTVPHFTPAGWLAVVFIGVSSATGYYLWLWALGQTTATSVSVFLALSPITAMVLGALLLAERISGSFLIGLMCVAFGLWLAHINDKQNPALDLPERSVSARQRLDRSHGACVLLAHYSSLVPQILPDSQHHDPHPQQHGSLNCHLLQPQPRQGDHEMFYEPGHPGCWYQAGGQRVFREPRPTQDQESPDQPYDACYGQWQAPPTTHVPQRPHSQQRDQCQCAGRCQPQK